MNSFLELTGKEKVIELLRWISILPAAMVGRLTAQLIVGVLMHLAAYSGSFTTGKSQFVYYLQLLLLYAPKKAAFVIIGAKTAPRCHLATTIVLAVAAVFMSLVVHVLGQHYPGVLNYTHVAAESAGAISGAAYNFVSETKARPSPRHPEADVESADGKLREESTNGNQ